MPAAALRRVFVGASLWLASLTFLAGCATTAPVPASSPTPRAVAPAAPTAPAPAGPTARYNLAGYSEGFKQGYADACASRRNVERFKSDSDYQMGWNDGQALCRK